MSRVAARLVIKAETKRDEALKLHKVKEEEVLEAGRVINRAYHASLKIAQQSCAHDKGVRHEDTSDYHNRIDWDSQYCLICNKFLRKV